MTRHLCIAALALAAYACDGEAAPTGLNEPIQVQGAAFKRGALPGRDEADAGAGDGPFVLSAATDNLLIRPGQSGLPFRGTASDSGYSIAIALEDAGSGYWVKPLGPPSELPGELSWNANLDFSRDLSPGYQKLQLVAIDEDGVAGPRSTFELCVTRSFEHTLNACEPTVLPPAAVISLSWDGDADLDLVLETPSGAVVDARHPSTLVPEDPTEFDPDAPGVGRLEPDSNPDCRVDAAKRETVTWNTSPERGEYRVYANLFEACGEPAAHFKLEAFVRVRGEEPDTYGIALLQEPIRGTVLGASANGGAKKGLLVGTVEFPH